MKFLKKKKQEPEFVDGINEPMGGKLAQPQEKKPDEMLTEEDLRNAAENADLPPVPEQASEESPEESFEEPTEGQAEPGTEEYPQEAFEETFEEDYAEEFGEDLESEPADAGEDAGEPGFFEPLPEEPEETGKSGKKKKKDKKQKKQKKNDSYLEKIPKEEMDERDEARMKRMKRRKKEMRRVRLMFALILLLLLGGAAAGTYFYLLSQGIDALSEVKNSDFVQNTGAFFENLKEGRFLPSGGEKKNETEAARPAETETATEISSEAAAAAAESERLESERLAESERQAKEEAERLAAQMVLDEADHMCLQYDYDKAIALLQGQQGYDSNQILIAKVQEIEALKASCVEVSPDNVVHVFVHSLIVDPARAFDGDAAERGYNLNMVTLDEFKKIIQSLYDNGYVLVSLHDMGEIDENGQMQRKNFLLPEGKKPLVFSQDDVSYYHSYTNDGFADKLLVDENGEVKNQYTDAEGNVTIGDYDMVPVLDTFIKEHPDFSYHGMKGIVVLTGYNGVFGYRTDADYRERASLQENQRAWLEAHPDFDIDADIAEATKVADAMKANGWEFASHTWGHIAVADVDYEHLAKDTQRWHDNVENIVGDTDMIIFAFGSDIGTWEGYSQDNEKFRLLKDAGFDYFCNVDGSTLSWVQFGSNYLRTGRMNIDGYRMASNPEILAPLFDVEQVYDYTNRPAMSEWGQ